MPLSLKDRKLHRNHEFLAQYYSNLAKKFPELQNHAALETMKNLAQHETNPEEMEPVFQAALESFRKDLSRITMAQQALWCSENHVKCELEGMAARGVLTTGKYIGGTIDGMVGMVSHISKRFNQTREAVDVPVVGDAIGLVGAACGFVEATAVGVYHAATDVLPSIGTAAYDSVMHPEYSNMQLAEAWSAATLNVQGVIGAVEGIKTGVPKVQSAAKHVSTTIKGAAEAVRNNMDNSGGLVPAMGTLQDGTQAAVAAKALPPLGSGPFWPLMAMMSVTSGPASSLPGDPGAPDTAPRAALPKTAFGYVDDPKFSIKSGADRAEFLSAVTDFKAMRSAPDVQVLATKALCEAMQRKKLGTSRFKTPSEMFSVDLIQADLNAGANLKTATKNALERYKSQLQKEKTAVEGKPANMRVAGDRLDIADIHHAIKLMDDAVEKTGGIIEPAPEALDRADTLSEPEMEVLDADLLVELSDDATDPRIDLAAMEAAARPVAQSVDHLAPTTAQRSLPPRTVPAPAVAAPARKPTQPQSTVMPIPGAPQFRWNASITTYLQGVTTLDGFYQHLFDIIGSSTTDTRIQHSLQSSLGTIDSLISLQLKEKIARRFGQPNEGLPLLAEALEEAIKKIEGKINASNALRNNLEVKRSAVLSQQENEMRHTITRPAVSRTPAPAPAVASPATGERPTLLNAVVVDPALSGVEQFVTSERPALRVPATPPPAPRPAAQAPVVAAEPISFPAVPATLDAPLPKPNQKTSGAGVAVIRDTQNKLVITYKNDGSVAHIKLNGKTVARADWPKALNEMNVGPIGELPRDPLPSRARRVGIWTTAAAALGGLAAAAIAWNNERKRVNREKAAQEMLNQQKSGRRK